MTSKLRLHIFIASVFLVGAAGPGIAQASSIYLTPPTRTITPGDAVQFELWMDFTGEPTIGGGVDVKFDNFTNGNQLTFDSYAPEPFGDPLLISTPVISAGGDALLGITFGDLIDGLEGPARVGTLAFTANSLGNYSFSLRDNVDAGGFFSTSGPLQFPLYTGASVTIEAAPPPPSATVPAPDTVWLILSGFAGLALRRQPRPASGRPA